MTQSKISRTLLSCRKLMLLALGLIASSCIESFGSNLKDHLVPIDSKGKLIEQYEKLVRNKLMVTPGDVARMVRLPGSFGVETVISIYRCREVERDAEFCITI